MATTETFLDAADYETIGEEFRKLWNTRRLALNYPVATILRYTEYSNPQTLSVDTISHSGLSITENIVGRDVNLVEGVLDQSYTVTGYTATSITVTGADFLADGFTTDCTFNIEPLRYQKLESPTKVQVTVVGVESLLNREVAYYNLTEQEVVQFNNELDTFDRRFVFYDIGEMANNDIIVSEGQQYAAYKQKYNVTYNKVSIYGKALRKT
jgi:hypothetical protein